MRRKSLKPRINTQALADVVKALTYVGILIIIFMLFRISFQNNQLAQQAKRTSEQNQRIAKSNGQHIDCISELFANYTRDNRPITIDDLDQCKVSTDEAKAIMSGAVDFTSTPSTKSPVPDNKNNGVSQTNQNATSHTPNSSSTPPPTAPDTTPPTQPPIIPLRPESLIPFVKEPLVGCIMKAVCL